MIRRLARALPGLRISRGSAAAVGASQTARRSAARSRITAGRLLAVLPAAAAVVALALTGVLVGALFAPATTPAHAAPGDIDPTTINLSAATSLTLTKLEQPQATGQPANGLPLPSLSGYTPIDGVTFQVTKVPLDHPLNTASGWQQATGMTIADAETRTAGVAPSATGTTGAGGSTGVIAFPTLTVGLYLVAEVSSAPGVLPGAPMLVVLPVQHPVATGTWLYDVNIYPKNAVVGITLAVNDADAIALGDPVTWSSLSSIPRVDTLGSYVVTNTIDPALAYIANPSGITLVSAPAGGAGAAGGAGGAGATHAMTRGPQHFAPTPPGVKVTLTGASGISLVDNDYDVTIVGQVITVTFLPSGLAKLAQARAADAASGVRVSYATTVLAEGVLQNVATVVANATGGASPAVSAAAVTKWGPLGILVNEVGNPANRIPGVHFKLYPSQADALAGTNPITVGGVSEWVTNAQGLIQIDGLRFSNFANGAARVAGDPLHRTYYAVMTRVPDGWKGSSQPLPVEVLSVSVTDMQVALVELRRENDLPVTGGQAIGWWIAGIVTVLGVGGAVLLAAGARRRQREALAQSMAEVTATAESAALAGGSMVADGSMPTEGVPTDAASPTDGAAAPDAAASDGAAPPTDGSEA